MARAFLFILGLHPYGAKPAPLAKKIDAVLLNGEGSKLCEVVELKGIWHLPDWAKDWLAECNNAALVDEQEYVISALPKPEIVDAFKERFKSGFSGALGFTAYLLGIGAYQIIKASAGEHLRTTVNKRPFLGVVGGVEYGSNGQEYGEFLAKRTDRRLIGEIIRHAAKNSEEVSDAPGGALEAAEKWLSPKGAETVEKLWDGALFVPQGMYSEGDLDTNPSFMPYWRDPRPLKGAIGKCGEFPVFTYKPVGSGNAIVAARIIGTGVLKIRDCILQSGCWGEVIIRAYEPEELQAAIAKASGSGQNVDEKDIQENMILEFAPHFQIDFTQCGWESCSFVWREHETPPDDKE
jgi:hypothetical protein